MGAAGSPLIHAVVEPVRDRELPASARAYAEVAPSRTLDAYRQVWAMGGAAHVEIARHGTRQCRARERRRRKQSLAARRTVSVALKRAETPVTFIAFDVLW